MLKDFELFGIVLDPILLLRLIHYIRVEKRSVIEVLVGKVALRVRRVESQSISTNRAVRHDQVDRRNR